MSHYRDAQINLTPEEAAHLCIEKLHKMNDAHILIQLIAALSERISNHETSITVPASLPIRYNAHHGNK